MAPRTVPEGSALSLDRIVHGPLRLGIVAALATSERRTFTELRDALGATDGNLNASLQKLEQAGYVAASKKAEGRVAVTEYQLTRAGQKALTVYLEQLERIVAPVRKGLGGGQRLKPRRRTRAQLQSGPAVARLAGAPLGRQLEQVRAEVLARRLAQLGTDLGIDARGQLVLGAAGALASSSRICVSRPRRCVM